MSQKWHNRAPGKRPCHCALGWDTFPHPYPPLGFLLVVIQAPASMGFPSKNNGVACRFLLQGIFPTQGLNMCLLHWQVGSLPPSHQGSAPGSLSDTEATGRASLEQYRWGRPPVLETLLSNVKRFPCGSAGQESARNEELLLLLSRFSRVRLCATPETEARQAPCPWDSPGKSTGVGCHCLLRSAGDRGSIPGLGRAPGEGKGYPLQYSDLENSYVKKRGHHS